MTKTEPTNTEIRTRHDGEVHQELDERTENELRAGGFEWVLDLLNAYNICRADRGILLDRLKPVAAELIRMADDLKQCSTIGGEWDGTEAEAKEEYDRLMSLAESLEVNNAP